MTPRQFLRVYRLDKRLVTGGHVPSDPLPIERGDRIGVVLLNLGGPDQPADVAPFLYNLFMDPAIIDMPVGRTMRHWLSRFIAKTRAKSVGKDYEIIGGGSPINRLTREQSQALERLLNKQYGAGNDIEFSTYIAMRYWHPFTEEATAKMQEDGINKVVLLPLYPQYSKTTTGSSFIYWWALEEAGEIPRWPTTSVFEYATNPKYIQALSERIDEGLQRFPHRMRDKVRLLFSAHGTPVKEMKERRDPYCCLIHSTVDRVMAYRENDRPFYVSFQSKVGPAEWLTPSTPDQLKKMAEDGHTAVLIIPIAFVTDHIETAYELDVEVRAEAEHFGIEHYEVTSGLNCHPLFIEALAEATIAQLDWPGEFEIHSGDGAPTRTYPLKPLNRLPRFPATQRSTRCHQCEFITEARCWTDACDGVKRAHPTEPKPQANQDA